MESFFAKMPLVISYYTKNTPYEEEAKNLIASCKQFGIEHHVEGVEDKGGWEENCLFKPYFIQQQLRIQQRSVLWVDVDAVFLRPLHFEEFMFGDLAILKYVDLEDPRFCIASGTVYINDTPGGKQAIDLWCFYADQIQKESKIALPFADQLSLNLTLLAKPPITIALLPLRYCAIFDQDKGQEESSIVIEHRQASRKYRKTASKHSSDLFSS